MKYLMALTLAVGATALVACRSQEEVEVVQEVADAETATLNVALM